MGEILNSVKTFFSVPRPFYLTLALLCLLTIPSALWAQTAQTTQPTQTAQDEDLPADDIIAILQQNPDVLAEAKAQIVAQLRDRGYPVTDRTLSDDRLFSEIRSDDRARHIMSEELKKRGFGVEPESAQPATGQQPAAPPASQGAGRPGCHCQPARCRKPSARDNQKQEPRPIARSIPFPEPPGDARFVYPGDH